MSQTNSRRTQRAEKEIRYWVSRYFLEHLRGELTTLLSITRVVVSGDLRTAKIFVHPFQNPNPQDETKPVSSRVTAKRDREFCDKLEAKQGEIQRFLSRHMPMRYNPRLHFFLDDSFDRVLSIEAILHDLKPTLEKPNLAEHTR